MPSFKAVLGVFAGIIALLSAAAYVFGIPPELKKAMQKKVLQTMGENKASYLVKDQISQMPESDQKTYNDVKKGLGNGLGGALNNPVGEKTGDFGDDITARFR